jgi:1-aminocyclopropane-1-carboxylate deaminase
LHSENSINTQVNGKMLFDISNIGSDQLKDELFLQKQVTVTVLRLDKLHPVVSGNKLFKLHYFLEEALATGQKAILTFGGAYSNHLVATAYACRYAGLNSIGIVRGERPPQLSHTLQQCIGYGMQLKFISREEYAMKDDEDLTQTLLDQFGDCMIIPEGGYHPLGAKGAGLIMDLAAGGNFTHVCTAIGTATTLAGLLAKAEKYQQIVGIPVLKGMTDIPGRVDFLTGDPGKNDQLTILDNYHFGGYAKKTPELIQFMNDCWNKYELPLDFVYTAKMFYAVMETLQRDHFPPQSRILCLHTGGLQGNESLPANSLLYRS